MEIDMKVKDSYFYVAVSIDKILKKKMAELYDA